MRPRACVKPQRTAGPITWFARLHRRSLGYLLLRQPIGPQASQHDASSRPLLGRVTSDAEKHAPAGFRGQQPVRNTNPDEHRAYPEMDRCLLAYIPNTWSARLHRWSHWSRCRGSLKILRIVRFSGPSDAQPRRSRVDTWRGSWGRSEAVNKRSLGTGPAT